MRGRAVPSLLRKIVLEGLAKILLIRLDLPDPLGRTNKNGQGSSKVSPTANNGHGFHTER